MLMKIIGLHLFNDTRPTGYIRRPDVDNEVDVTFLHVEEY